MLKELTDDKMEIAGFSLDELDHINQSINQYLFQFIYARNIQTHLGYLLLKIGQTCKSVSFLLHFVRCKGKFFFLFLLRLCSNLALGLVALVGLTKEIIEPLLASVDCGDGALIPYLRHLGVVAKRDM